MKPTEFDYKAKEWDNNPLHIERSEAIAKAMTGVMPLKKLGKALEFGAGTGLLSFFLQDMFEDITLVDSSPEMISVLKRKISGQRMKHMKAILVPPESTIENGNYDIIYSQMVFHHIENIDKPLLNFRQILRPGGYLSIADLYPEDGSFHGGEFTGHYGFDPEQLANRLIQHGFIDIEYSKCFIINKVTKEGINKAFPVFLMKAIKSDNRKVT